MGEPHFLVSFSYIILSSCISHCEFDFTQRHILSQSLCRSFNNGVKTVISGNLCHKAEFTVTQNFLNFIFRWLRLRAAVFSNPLIPKISGWYSFLFLLQNSQLSSELMFFVWFCCCFVIPYVIQLTAILLYYYTFCFPTLSPIATNSVGVLCILKIIAGNSLTNILPLDNINLPFIPQYQLSCCLPSTPKNLACIFCCCYKTSHSS